MIRRPPRSTRTDTLFPYTTLFRSASVLMGGFLTRAQIPQDLAAAMLEFTDNKYVILFILNMFFLIIGFFLHSAAAIILVVPIVLQLIVAAHIDPVHFGLMVTLNLAIDQQTQPVHIVVIVSCSSARAKHREERKHGGSAHKIKVS